MGVPMSLLGKLGFPGTQSLSTDRIFDQFFNKNITTFEEFHITFLDVCNKFNSAMPGEYYRTPSVDELKKYFSQWTEEKDPKLKKKLLVEYMANHIDTVPTDNVVLATGVLAPPTAMIVKKAADNLPPLKKFRLHLVPDFIFIPSVTCLALVGAKLLRMNSGSGV